MIWAIFRGSWQKRLAKKLGENLSQKDVLSKLEEAVRKYWNSTETAFKQGADEVERQWQQKLEELRLQIENPEKGRKRVEETLERLEDARRFFSLIPWEEKVASVI